MKQADLQGCSVDWSGVRVYGICVAFAYQSDGMGNLVVSVVGWVSTDGRRESSWGNVPG